LTDFALFLDRDGVINRQRVDHVKSWAEFEFLPGALDGLARLHRIGIRVIVITNQAAVGRGLLEEQDLVRIHQHMCAAVRDAAGDIERVYACLHTPEAGCRCRKPGTALLERASGELGIDLAGSIMAGDSIGDLEAARAAGCLPIVVGSGDWVGRDRHVAHARDLVEVAALIPLLRSVTTAC
jgi:D-glycero-D-manno-heptose 1,7-bisphosphate phosphatase